LITSFATHDPRRGREEKKEKKEMSFRSSEVSSQLKPSSIAREKRRGKGGGKLNR